MPKLVILTDIDAAAGYRVAGVEVREAEPETALAVLEELIESGEYGLVAVDEGLLSDPVKDSERAMRGRDLPVLLSIPSMAAAFSDSDDVTAYMSELVRSAIGFDIKLE